MLSARRRSYSSVPDFAKAFILTSKRSSYDGGAVFVASVAVAGAVERGVGCMICGSSWAPSLPMDTNIAYDSTPNVTSRISIHHRVSLYIEGMKTCRVKSAAENIPRPVKKYPIYSTVL